jgi:hypothetical protein
LVFLVDGSRPDVFSDLVQKNLLPNISKYIVNPGGLYEMMTVFPSTTGPAYLPYLTGCYPGTCGVPGIRWFDREQYAKKGWGPWSIRSYVGLETMLMNSDITPSVKTAYDFFEHPISIFNNINRGIDSYNDKSRFQRIWYYYYGHLTDHWSFIDIEAGNKLIDALDENPDFGFIVFPGVDEYSHRSSPFHPKAIKAYQTFDKVVGDIVEKLKSKNWLDDTLMMIVSDHGLSETKNHFDIGPYLEEKGLKTLYHTNIFKSGFDAATMVSGNGMSHIYLKGESGWGERTYFEEIAHTSLMIDDLRLKPDIDLVTSLGSDGNIYLATERGFGNYKIIGDQVHYEWQVMDPLGLIDQKSVGKGKLVMSLDESYRKTFNTHYPDVFVQMEQLFRTNRTGDIVISATTGYDLRDKFEHPEHRSSHGAICPEHMKVPLLMNAKIKSNDEIPVIRSVDVFPTYLDLLNKPIPDNIDGRSLV